ncbi:MAG: hypothetical protein HFH69_05360 [Lachnospiraceae bacterium]|nr:hypothetical protein [Lachnospiraceae bacterium]
MEDEKELLRSRIERISDPVQKVLLRDVLADVFGELLRYSNEQFSQLEKRLDAEISDPSRLYYIDTGVCKKDGLDDTSQCLFGIKAGKVREKGYLGKLFLACDYPVICQCLHKPYQALVETDQGEFKTTVSLKYCRDYLETFGNLYKTFLANQKQWHTVNCPFLYKFLSIMDREGVVPQDALVQRVEIMLGELSRFVVNDAVPVWNVQEDFCKPEVEVAAAGQKAVYVHNIHLPDDKAGYLAAPEGEDFFQTVFSDGNFSVRTEKEAHKNMKLFKIASIDYNRDGTELLYPLQTNRRKMRFVDRQAQVCPRYLWTRGETERILSSYEVFQDFVLVDICTDLPGELEGLDLNPFIKENSLLQKKRKITIILHPKDETDIFRYEKMFFLLAELQLCTKEYQWTGILR